MSAEIAATSYAKAFRSDNLKKLRQLIRAGGLLRGHFEEVAEFRLVIDTNIALAEIVWRVCKRKDPSARTWLTEVIDAGTAEVYAPTALIAEVDKYIVPLADKHCVDVELLLKEWTSLRTHLKIIQPKGGDVSQYPNSIDPKDVPFVALAAEIRAAGVLSRDPHIERLGGQRIPIDCMLHLRDYSRSRAVELGLKVGGISISGITIGGAAIFVKGIAALGRAFANAPPLVKLLVLAGMAFCVLHRPTRTKLASLASGSLSLAKEVGPMALEQFANAYGAATDHSAAAEKHLTDAKKYFGPREV